MEFSRTTADLPTTAASLLDSAKMKTETLFRQTVMAVQMLRNDASQKEGDVASSPTIETPISLMTSPIAEEDAVLKTETETTLASAPTTSPSPSVTSSATTMTSPPVSVTSSTTTKKTSPPPVTSPLLDIQSSPPSSSARVTRSSTPGFGESDVERLKTASVKGTSRTPPFRFEQKLSERSKESKVPASRVSRLLSYGGLAAGLGVGAISEVTQRALGFKRPGAGSIMDSSAFFTEANAERIVNTLCRVRGAALKLGQMLSIQDSSFINPQIQKIFERVRQSADFMPNWQMERVLVEELGQDWREKFAEFEEKPFAAASIGQVHRARLKDGKEVALKIQYPGVAQGIESDINNLMAILSVWNLLPKGLYAENVMKAAKRELSWEVDYIREANCLKRFREYLKDDDAFAIPQVIDELSTKQILTTELITGIPLDKTEEIDQETRNWIGTSVLRLCLNELFVYQFMQTDPNWSNFFYNSQEKKIYLLDFGASRDFSSAFTDKYIRIIRAAADGDREKVLYWSQQLGFLTGFETKLMENAHIDAVMILGEAFSSDGDFDFGLQSTTRQIQSLVPTMAEHRLTPPPEETYSLHRKMSGAFLLCAKLKSKVNCRPMFDSVWKAYKFSE